MATSVNGCENVKREKKITSEGRMTGFGLVWVPGQGTFRQYRNITVKAIQIILSYAIKPQPYPRNK